MYKFKVKIENEEGAKSTVSIEPLEQGYGHTLGNSLRRTMLNSLGGAAISSVKISGVSHQFSTVSGVVEDVIEIILNLKKVRVKVYGDKPIKLVLQKTGKGEVKAGDLDALGLGEVRNPDQHIATLTDPKAKLNMEMVVELGVGYVNAEEKRTNEIGVIPVDAIFTPVFAVNYTVDQTRVGRRTDFERLTMDITTDGTLSAKEAVEKASQILTGYFKQVYEPEEEVIEVVEHQTVSEDLLKASVEELDLPVRITNALKAIDIDNIATLIEVSSNQLMKAKNLGAKSLNLISEKLTERGLKLNEA